MTSVVPMRQALSQNFLTAGSFLILIIGICTILFVKHGYAIPGEKQSLRAPPILARMFGYTISSVGVVVVCFVVSYVCNMGFVPALFVLASVLLIGVPLILTLERYRWFSEGADNGTVGASVGLGFVGAAYSFFVLDVLWYILKLILQGY